MQPYIHKTPTRLRVRSEFIRINPVQVSELLEKMGGIEGINTLSHKKYAGSVTVRFDEKVLDHDALLEVIESHGWLGVTNNKDLVTRVVQTGTRTLVKSLFYLTIQRTLGGSAAKLLSAL